MACTRDSFSHQFWKTLGVLMLLVLGLPPVLRSQAPAPASDNVAPATNPGASLPPPPPPVTGEPATTPLPPPPTPPEPAAPALPPPPPSPPDEEMQPSDNPDEQVRFRFTFEGDSRPPTLGSEADPPPAPPPPPPNPEDYLGHDPNKPVTYSLDDDEPEEEEPKEKLQGGIQWDQLLALLGKGSDWYIANIIWTGPSSGVLVISALGFLIVGSVKKKKQKQAIQAQFEERKKLREQRKPIPGKRKTGVGAVPKKGRPSPPPLTESVPEIGEHIFLCFTGYDDKPAQVLRKALTKSGYDIRCRKLENGTAKIFDNETVELISSARAVLLVASSSAYTSERVLSETQHARDEEKLIVPIYLDDSELPKSFEYLAEDPEYVYFDLGNAKDSILEIVAFLSNRELPPA